MNDRMAALLLSLLLASEVGASVTIGGKASTWPAEFIIPQSAHLRTTTSGRSLSRASPVTVPPRAAQNGQPATNTTGTNPALTGAGLSSRATGSGIANLHLASPIISDDVVWIGTYGDKLLAVTSRGALLDRFRNDTWRVEGSALRGIGVPLPIRSAASLYGFQRSKTGGNFVDYTGWVDRDGDALILAGDVNSPLYLARFARLLFEGMRLNIATLSFGPAGHFAVSNDGHVLTLSTQSQWLQKPSPSKDIRAITFRDQTNAIASGVNGFLATTNDAGRTWTTRRSNTTATLKAIAFGPKKVVYAAGSQGTILRSDDSGATFRHVAAEWNRPPRDGIPLPPPWYLLFNALVTLPLLAIAARSLPRDRDTIETDSVADAIGSDRALEKGDPDPMNLGAIALAISRFLRNESTLPPLTIAVTGEWGSGKSSLMNLLRADLTDFGFRPVWFNAWHHQKEEHLLASLLQAVRQQAVPRWWRPENFFFRVRLIWIRGWKHRANLLLLLLFLSLAIGYESRHHGGNPFEPVDKAVQEISQNDFKTVAKDIPSGVQNEFVALMSLVAILGTAWRGLKAFRMNPATLLTTLSGSAKVNDLAAEIGFRDKFAAEFNDVTKALGVRSLLIFIDDLDRCSPSSVGEVLEAVNFLVSSGDCFIVMGMDRKRVERYVNLNFKEVSANEPDFATKYLDKLINIEVPVPEPTDDASTQILVPLHLENSEGRSNWTVVRQLAADSLHFWPVALAIAVIAAGFLSGRMIEGPPVSTPPPITDTSSIAAPATATATATITTSTSSPSVSVAPIPQAALKTDQPGDVKSGVARAHFWVYWPAVLFLIPLIGVGVWLFTRPRDLVIHDSPLFLDAVSIWRPLIVQKLRTPRGLKRFMNRLRYLAMRQRPQAEELTLWRQVKLWITGKKRETPSPVMNAIPEPALVALAAMELFPGHPEHDIGMLVGKQEEHRQRFGHSPSDWAEAYRQTTAGVHAN
jgi:KAP family P-loop domain